MSKSFKGLKLTLIFSVFFFIAAIIRIIFQFKTGLTQFQILVNTILIFISVYFAYKFFKGYKNYIVITDQKIIISRLLKNKKININEISKVYCKDDVIIIDTKSKKNIKIALLDIAKEDRENFENILFNM